MKAFERDSYLMVIVERGEKLVATLTAELERRNLRGGFITGLGALTDVELGYYFLHRRDYKRRTFKDEYELISLTGNVALKDGKPFVHVHAALGDEGFGVFGGHLFEAVSAVTVELSVCPFPFVPGRRFNDDVGLATLCALE